MTVAAASPSRAAPTPTTEPRWLLLFHQIPPNPAYLRVKVGRHLARVGAVGLKNAVYALPRSEAALEDLQWVVREIIEVGGDASLCEARFVDQLTDDDIEQRFRDARDEEYGELARDARELLKTTPKQVGQEDEGRKKLEADIGRLERRFEEVFAMDFFKAPGSQTVEGLIRSLRARLAETDEPARPAPDEDARGSYRGKVWVTRTGVHVDRIATAWLVRRFVDEVATFKFVAGKAYRPEPGEVRFDMFEAEFTHDGDRCTFEVLADRLSIRSAGIRALAEIVHDIDLKDSKFGRPETAGIAAAVAGLCAEHRSDDARLELGFALFDGLRAHFSRKKT